MIETLSLLKNIPLDLADESFDPILSGSGFRLERIVSKGHITAPGDWYDQAWHEWVLLIKGEARVAIEGQADECLLAAGDTLLLPAGCRHRVEWTAPDEETVWLALHFDDGDVQQKDVP